MAGKMIITPISQMSKTTTASLVSKLKLLFMWQITYDYHNLIFNALTLWNA